MNNQKDTQKTTANLYGQANVSDNKTLSDMSLGLGEPMYDFVNKKTEKLVTALYMVTDCMETEDALKSKLRLLGVKLLSDMYEINTLTPMDKYVRIPVSLIHIYEILSFIEIAYTIGFISEMNTNILKKEFNFLASELKSYQTKDKHFTFTLDEKMFENNKDQKSITTRQDLAQDIRDNNLDKRTTFNSMSFINKKSPLKNYEDKNRNFYLKNLSDKEDRSKKIIDLIKDKKNTGDKELGVSIKDISLAFTDCSEKTIQRELNSLVLKGKLKKTGAKRWSRYALVSSS